MQSLINSTNLATVLGVSNATVRKWINCGKISPIKKDSLYSYFDPLVLPFPEFKEMNESSWEKEEQIKQRYQTLSAHDYPPRRGRICKRAGLTPALIHFRR